MIPPAVVFLLALSIVLAVAAVGVSLFAVWRSRVLVLAADARFRAGMKECEAATDTLRRTADATVAQMRELQQVTPGSQAIARPGLNLSKRSHVLRMHRNGEPQDRIAAALGIPLQEVDLLIKVHRVVIKSL